MTRATQQNKDTHQCIFTERLQGRSIQKIECDNFFKYKTASNCDSHEDRFRKRGPTVQHSYRNQQLITLRMRALVNAPQSSTSENCESGLHEGEERTAGTKKHIEHQSRDFRFQLCLSERQKEVNR